MWLDVLTGFKSHLMAWCPSNLFIQAVVAVIAAARTKAATATDLLLLPSEPKPAYYNVTLD